MSVLTSRRFWTAIVDLVVATTGFVVAHYVPNANTAELVKFLVVAVQPVVGILILSYTTEDVASMKYGTTLKAVAKPKDPQQ